MRIITLLLFFIVSTTTGCKNKAATQDQPSLNGVIKEAKINNEKDIYCSVPTSPTNNTEEIYAEAISQNTMAEQAFCKLAESRASKESIRAFAVKIAFENDTINEPFIQIIIKKRILLVDGLQPALQHELTILERTKENVDKAFLNTLILNYQRSVTAYESGLSKLNDVELKRDALNMLAVKKDHLTEAQHLLDQID